MSALARYLGRRFAAMFGLVLLGLGGLLLGLDLLEYADDVLDDPIGAAPLVRYAALRLPQILSQLFTIAAMIGGLIVVESLNRHHELHALWSIGRSEWQLMGALAPTAVLLFAAYFVIIDQLVPRSVLELREWDVGPEAGRNKLKTDDDVVWMRSGDHVLKIPAEAALSRDLRNVTAFRRSADGVLLDRLQVGRIERAEDHWLFLDVVRWPVADGVPEPIAELPWYDPIGLDVVEEASGDPNELSLAVIADVIRNRGYGQLPVELFRISFHSRLADPLSAPLLLFLAVALAQTTRVRQDAGRLLITGIGVGFAFFIYDGITRALGEVGLLPAWLAAWSPKVVLGCLVGYLSMR